MFELMKDWKGAVEVNGKTFNSAQDAESALKCVNAGSHIILRSHVQRTKQNVSACSDVKQYRITVKAYMTRHATPEFDFMANWNKDVPMPMRIMTGTVEKETRGMVYMKLHGEGFPTCTCMRCGRELTNPISKYYGIGPECMSKLGFVCDIDEVDAIKLGMREIKWSGWIIKSAILEQEEIKSAQN